MCASLDCRWVVYGLLGGSMVHDFDLSKMLSKRIQLSFTTLRNRSDEFKTKLINDFSKEILPNFSTGGMAPVIDTIMHVSQIKEAHEKMENNINIGKIVMTWHDKKI
jgi:NADPH:quinone reductase-like Zn-dependent oxidoreductase